MSGQTAWPLCQMWLPKAPRNLPRKRGTMEGCVCVQKERENSPPTPPPHPLRLLHSSLREEALIERRELGSDPCGVGGKTLPGNPPALSGGVISFSSRVSKDGCLSFSLSLN